MINSCDFGNRLIEYDIINFNEKGENMETKQKGFGIAIDALVLGSIIFFSFLAILCAVLCV